MNVSCLACSRSYGNKRCYDWVPQNQMKAFIQINNIWKEHLFITLSLQVKKDSNTKHKKSYTFSYVPSNTAGSDKLLFKV